MSTRGAYGFRVDGVDKVQYNHFDSYPSGLGVEVVEFLRGTRADDLRPYAEAIRLVSHDYVPTKADIALCQRLKLADLSVSTKSITDLYCLTRHAQGDIGVYLRGLDFMVDGAGFLRDSLFCEWAYIVNLDDDDGVLEVYRGFNKNPQATGRYAELQRELRDYEIANGSTPEWYGVVLIDTIPLDELPGMTDEAFIARIERLVYEDDDDDNAAVATDGTPGEGEGA
jgi:hypothetical protein